MFVIVTDFYGTVSARGPYETIDAAHEQVVNELQEIVKEWGPTAQCMTRDELLHEYTTARLDLFYDTDIDILVVELEAP